MRCLRTATIAALLLGCCTAFAAVPPFPDRGSMSRSKARLRPVAPKLGMRERVLVINARTKSAARSGRLSWVHFGPGPQFIEFRIYSRPAITSAEKLIGTTTNWFFDIPFTQAQEFFHVTAFDRGTGLESR